MSPPSKRVAKPTKPGPGNAHRVTMGSELLGGVLGPPFSPNLLASASNPLIIAQLLWLKSWSLTVLIPLERGGTELLLSAHPSRSAGRCLPWSLLPWEGVWRGRPACQGGREEVGPEERCSPGSSPFFPDGARWWGSKQKTEPQYWHRMSPIPCLRLSFPTPQGSSRESLHLQLMAIPGTDTGTLVFRIGFPHVWPASLQGSWEGCV